MPPLDESLLGRMLDEYRVVRALGKGGMARVYLALDTRLQRHVALKVIAPDLRADREHTLRFEREAQSIARLDHPNIVHIFRFGAVGDLYYMAMQYIDGVDLERIIRDSRRDGELLALPDVASTIRDIGAALDYAHSRGVIHRDVKPGNILLDQGGRAVLTDFGLALLGEASTPGEVFGSPHYIAPEQASGSGNVVPQTDLYALGAVLFYMLVGEVPFLGSDPSDIARRHISETPRAPSAVNPALSPEIDAVVLRCLEKEPHNRFQTGAELSAALSAAIAATAESSAPSESAQLRHSQIPVREKVQAALRELPPLPELESLPPPPPEYRQVTQPVPSASAAPTWTRVPPPPRETPVSRPSTPVPLIGTPHRERLRLWIAAGLAFGSLLIVLLCGLLVLSLVGRGAGLLSAAAPDTAAPTLTVTPSSALFSTPSQAPWPTRTLPPTPTALVLFGTLPAPAAFPTSFPTLFPATFPAILPTAVLPLPAPGMVPADRNAPPPGGRRLGEFAVEWYCNERGLGVTLINGDVDWACTNPDGAISFILQPTDFDQICRTWYTNPGAFAIRDQQNPTQAYNWSCYDYGAANTSNSASGALPDQLSLATPSVMSLRIETSRDWVVFSNDSTLPLSLASFYLEREGRRIDASAWGRSVLSPGECLVIHKSDELPEAVFSECARPLSLAADKREREYWLKGEVLVYVNPDAQYRYRVGR